jgi:DNA-binding response OmpR family regulator
MAESAPKKNGDGLHDGSPCVLVVEDNEGVANALARLLEHEGWRVVLCYNGLDALRQLECTEPAAAVLDIHLPDISGLILSSKLRERFGPKLPIIVLSGDTSMENIRSLSHVGANYFISKPFNSDHLLEQLRELAPAQ